MTVSAPQGPNRRLGGLRRRFEPRLQNLRHSDTAKAAGLAGAMVANSVLALIATVVFARVLSDYGSLAALISYFLILSVVGQAIQVATAREGVLGHLGVGPDLVETMKRWGKTLAIVTVGLTIVSVLLRNPIASLVGVKHDQWAAAIGLPAGCLWLGLSILRGALQGAGKYKAVGLSLIGEQAVRLVSGAVLAVVGLGVTGAFLGTPISFIVMGVYCTVHLRRYAAEHPSTEQADADRQAALGLWRHFTHAWAPIAGLIVIAVLQNIDIIAAKHRFNGIHNMASSYAATAVAAKVLVWVAIGASFYLVPEVSRRRAEGKDTRPVLFKALAIIGVCAIPVLLIFAFGSHQLMSAVFKRSQLRATDSLFVLGVAFTVMAATYLAIQYMLALRRTWFLIVLAVVAIAEPILLLQAPRTPDGFAAIVLAVQAAGALLAFGLALRRDRPPRPTPVPTARDEAKAPTRAAPAGVGSP